MNERPRADQPLTGQVDHHAGTFVSQDGMGMLVFLTALLTMLANGCATGLGPKALRSERPDYNQQIVRSADAEMLLNLVRLHYNESPLFLDLGAIVAQYGYGASFNATGQINGTGPSDANVGTGLDYSERPTVTYTPLTGDEYAERLLAPIPLDAVMLFSHSGWSAERLLLVAVERVNDVFNAPTATGPLPERTPDYEAFADLADRLHRLQSAGLVVLNWERKEHETNQPERDSRLWVHQPADSESPLAADVAAVRRALDLEPGRDDFRLTAFPFGRQRDEVGMRCRSLLGVLYFLSASVEPPAPHVAAGLVTVTRHEDGQPFDWSKVTGKVMAIHSRQERPQNAYVAVQYRGWWFYIADDDRNSKATFSLLNILFSLQSATGKGRSPLLTLPLGD
jgi:hypothetical protein